MPDQRAHYQFMRSEFDRLPATLLGPGDPDKDLVFHHACWTHANSLTEMRDKLFHAWFDIEIEMRGTTHGNADNEVELVFAERLALWLREHAAYVERVAAGGEIDPGRVKAKAGSLEKYIAAHRLYATRHFDMVGDYCDRMATRLELRAAELRHDLSFAN